MTVNKILSKSMNNCFIIHRKGENKYVCTVYLCKMGNYCFYVRVTPSEQKNRGSSSRLYLVNQSVRVVIISTKHKLIMCQSATVSSFAGTKKCRNTKIA